MQRALHGLGASPLRARDRAARRRVSSPPSSTIPARAVRARALVESTRFSAARGGGHRRPGRGLRRRRRPPAAARRGSGWRCAGWFTPLGGFDERWRWSAVGAFHATDVLGVAPTGSPLTKLANDARELVLAGSGTSGRPIARCWPASSSVTPRRARGSPSSSGPRAHPPDRSRGERRLRPRPLRTAAPPARAARRVLAAMALLIAFGTMTAGSRRCSGPSRWPCSRWWPGTSAVRRRACGCSRWRDALLLGTRSSCTRSGSVVVRGEPGHHAAGA
jgi:hypothetical protein